jgi:branched-chain amino acid transport system ATP-binding protein
VIEVAGLSAGYGRSTVLHDVSMRVCPAEIVAVVGPNGAGKSTLLRVISGQLGISAGAVSFDGRNLTSRRATAVGCPGVGYAPEGRRLFPSLTVQENLALGTYSVPGRARRTVAREQLALVHELFPVLKNMRARPAGLLSGGQQQMLALGRAIMSRPRYLLLDEPSMGLAPVMVETIATAIQRLAGTGVGVLLVEQMVGLALQLAERVYVLRAGRVTDDGPSGAFRDGAERLHLAYFGTTGAGSSARASAGPA